MLRHDHEFYLAVPRACFGVALFRAAVVVGSAETNEGNPIQVTPMVVSGGSDAVKCREML